MIMLNFKQIQTEEEVWFIAPLKPWSRLGKSGGAAPEGTIKWWSIPAPAEFERNFQVPWIAKHVRSGHGMLQHSIAWGPE
jgi:hypothetical protein